MVREMRWYCFKSSLLKEYFEKFYDWLLLTLLLLQASRLWMWIMSKCINKEFEMFPMAPSLFLLHEWLYNYFSVNRKSASIIVNLGMGSREGLSPVIVYIDFVLWNGCTVNLFDLWKRRFNQNMLLDQGSAKSCL